MPHLFVPQDGSTVEIICRAEDNSNTPFWAIDLANDSSLLPLPFSTRNEQLNAHGVYELSQQESPLTLRLLINNTAANNQTEINCDRGALSITTILTVFGKFGAIICIIFHNKYQ